MQTTKVLEETVIRQSERHRLPGNPSVQRLTAWRLRGVKCRATGVRHTLEWCYVGGEPVTSLEAYERFNRRVNGENGNGVSGGNQKKKGE